MESAKRKKTARVVPPLDDDQVEVRVSSGAARAKTATPPVARAQNLALGLLEVMIGQVADYIENSHAVERLVRAQTSRVLRELAHDPQLTALIRAQAYEYLRELTAHPEILEPLVRAQVDRYLGHQTAVKPKSHEKAEPVAPKRKRTTREVKID